MIFYFRYKIARAWQGSDLLQSSMMIEDLTTLIQQNKLGNFDKLVVVPRLDDDLPFFVQDELEKKFGKEWVGEHLEITNEYHKYDQDQNTHWVELVDGMPHSQNIGVLGGVFEATGKHKMNKGDYLICKDIFWPDHAGGTIQYIDNAKFNIGLGRKQASTLKMVRESLLRKVIEMDKLIE